MIRRRHDDDAGDGGTPASGGREGGIREGRALGDTGHGDTSIGFAATMAASSYPLHRSILSLPPSLSSTDAAAAAASFNSIH